MLVLQIEPAIALIEELGLLAGPQPIDDLAGLVAQGLRERVLDFVRGDQRSRGRRLHLEALPRHHCGRSTS